MRILMATLFSIALMNPLLATAPNKPVPAKVEPKLSKWTFDQNHSAARFKIFNLAMLSKVPGAFSGMQGVVVVDENDVTTAKVEVVVDVKTIQTGNEQRDTHLRSKDYFDVSSYPTMKFVSTALKRNADGTLDMIGKLTIKGLTKEVSWKVTALAPAPVKDQTSRFHFGLEATTRINRLDFKVGDTLLLANDVDLEIDVGLVSEGR